MSSELVSVVIGFISFIIGIIPTYLFMRQKNVVEIEKLKAETDKIKAEAEKIRSELQPSQSLTIEQHSIRTNNKKDIVSRENLEELRNPIENFRELLLVGINLRRLTISYHNTLFKQIKSGAMLKVILVNPDGLALQFLADRSTIHRTPDAMTKSICMTLHNLADIYAEIPQGRLEVRVLDYVPSYSMIIVNPKDAKGIIRVDTYPYKVSPEENPGFFVNENVNHEWRKFFIEQFDKLWNSAKEIELKEWRDK